MELISTESMNISRDTIQFANNDRQHGYDIDLWRKVQGSRIMNKLLNLPHIVCIYLNNLHTMLLKTNQPSHTILSFFILVASLFSHVADAGVFGRKKKAPEPEYSWTLESK